MRLSDAVGGLAVGGLIVLIALSLADNDDPTTIDAGSPFTITTDATSQGGSEPGAPEEPGATTTSQPTTTIDAPTTEAPTSTSPPPPSSTAAAPTTTVLVQPNFRPFIELQVLNAGARAGQASTAAEQLEGAGFAPRPARDAAVPTDATTILYAPGRAVEAATVNQVFGIEPERVIEAPPDDPNWLQFGTDLHVLVILGPTT